MTDEQLWPRSLQDPAADARKLLEFIDKEILTLEFVQGIDADVERELAKTIADYRATKNKILEAIAFVKGS